MSTKVTKIEVTEFVMPENDEVVEETAVEETAVDKTDDTPDVAPERPKTDFEIEADKFINNLDKEEAAYFNTIRYASNIVIQTCPKWILFKDCIKVAGIPDYVTKDVEDSMGLFLALKTVAKDTDKSTENIEKMVNEIVDSSIKEFFDTAGTQFAMGTVLAVIKKLGNLEDATKALEKNEKDSEENSDSE